MIYTHLPLMNNETYQSVYGSIKFSIQERKLAVVLGSPGSGKTTALKKLEAESAHNHYILCSPNTTMHSLLIAIANAVNVDVKGSNDRIQTQLTAALQADPNHCIMLDECEYLHKGNVSKIDVIRQIYDETGVPFVLCGTYKLKSLLVGNNKEENDQPQIVRRLLKSEFGKITKEEILTYLELLEKTYAVRFVQEAKIELVTLCQDRANGGLGIFMALLELVFSIVRPEWKDISRQLHYEEEQKLKSTSDITDDDDIPKGPDGLPLKFIDISKLNTVLIDKKTLRDISRFKMTK